ncbi:MAG: substrate-binding domain-containing protein, partial [Pseudolysinimonas sp.]
AVAALRQRRVPVVAIEAMPMDDVVAIDLDNRDASRRGAQHLYELGHRRVAVVTLPLDSARTQGEVTPERLAASAAHTTRERLAGVREVLPTASAQSATGSTIDEGVRIGRMLLEVRPAQRPTAIIAQSDLLAVGVIRAAEQLGLEVPRDLSVVGFDGVRLEGATAHILTTLVQPAVEKGRAAAAAVLAELAGGHGQAVLFHSELRIGTTTGAPAVSTAAAS